MLRFLLTVLLTVLLFLAPAPAMAWGAQGHEIIATIAVHQLTPRARAELAKLLGSPEMLIHESNWADEIRNRRRDTGSWHYVNIPLDARGYLASRDCPSGQCVVAQIVKMRQALADTRLPAVQRADALRFLIHLVADLHQPLHAADNGDRGGNDTRITVQRRRTNLHQLWDSRMVEALGTDVMSIAQDIESRISARQRSAWQTGTPVSWVNESHHLARDRIYAMLIEGRSLSLPPDYVRTEGRSLRGQLAKAGLRLGRLLNESLN